MSTRKAPKSPPSPSSTSSEPSKPTTSSEAALRRAFNAPTKQFFSKVKEARRIIRERSVELFEKYMAEIDLASAEGDHKTSLEGLQWLIAHMPHDDEGDTMISSSIDKQADSKNTGPTGPAIQIGIALGGMKPEPKSLPAVIDVTNDKD